MADRSRAIFAVLVIFLLSLGACAPELVPPDWILLARQEIAFVSTSVVITVPPAAPPVKRVRIVPRMNDIGITRVKVLLEDGVDVERTDRVTLLANRETIALDLPGDARRVREVVVEYYNDKKTVHRAVIEIWGDPS